MSITLSEGFSARRRSPLKEKGRSREYIFGPISADDVEWAKSAFDMSLQVKRQPTNVSDIARLSTIDSEGISGINNGREACVSTNGDNMMGLISNVQELSLKLGAEGRQRESLEHQLVQLREQNKQLMAEVELLNAEKKDCTSYMKAVETIKKLDVNDFNQNCEDIMDAIYTIICDAFGPENNLSLLFEEMADIYLKNESKHEMEVKALHKQIDVLSKLENVLKGEVQPKSKSVDMLVEQLKTTKEEAAEEIRSLRKDLNSAREECVKMEEKRKEIEKLHELEREELTLKLKVHQDRCQQLMRDQGMLLSQMPLLKLSPTENDAEDDILRQTGASTLESLISALYRKDAEMQKLLKHKEGILQKQQNDINILEARIKDWEADAVLWLDYVNQDSARMRSASTKAN